MSKKRGAFHNQFSILLGELGKSQNKYCSFQNEWKYILNIVPFDMNKPITQSYTDFQISVNKIKMGLERQAVKYYDLIIDDTAFSEMEITLCPNISAGNKIIIESLVEKYNPQAIIKQSNLVGLI